MIEIRMQGSESGDELIFRLVEYLKLSGIEVLEHIDDTPKTDIAVAVNYKQNDAFMHRVYFVIGDHSRPEKELYTDCVGHNLDGLIEIKRQIITALYDTIVGND